MHFNELQRRMPEDMTHTTLSRQLKALEKDGLIVCRVYSEIPPKVEYELSKIGHKFEKVLAVLEVLGNEYIDFMNQRQASTTGENFPA